MALSSLIVLLALLAPAMAAGLPPATLAFPPGPHAAGFRVLSHRDAARRAPDGSLRPVQVSLWYPAAAGAASSPMQYRDYVLVSTRERTLAALDLATEQEAMARYRAFLAKNGLSAAGIDAWLGSAMLARLDAPAASGRFPLVVIAQGMGGATPDQAALGEWLASYGYVVATTPSPVRLGSRMESDADVPAMADEQARDMEVALSVASAQPVADPARTGLIGYSFGARAALLAAGRRPAVKALVSLDGGIGSSAAKGWLAPGALDRRALRVPVLHVYEETDEDARPDFGLLASLTAAPRTLARVDGLRHLDFITVGLASASLPPRGGPDPRRLAALRAGFETARAYLDAHVAGDDRAWRALTATGSGENGLLRIVRFGSAAHASPRPRTAGSRP